MSLPVSQCLHVYKSGRLTVIGFDGRDLMDALLAEEIQDRLLDLINTAECQILAVDLMDVGIVSSWILGILAAVRQRGIQVELYHPSQAIREVLDTTQLNRLLHVRETWGDGTDSNGVCAFPTEIGNETA